jgi:hypothetical protein
MSRIIRVKNTLADNSPYSFVTSTMAAGGTSIPVKNPNAFQASWAVQIGNTGEETSEIFMLGTAAPDTTLILTGTTKYPHSVDTPVYAIKYDTIVFERSTAGTAGTATPLTGGTITIQADHDYTQFDDTSGATGYAYRAYFENSLAPGTVITSESDWITDTGFSFYSKAKIRERVKDGLFNAGYLNKTDQQVDNWINEWLESMNNVAVDVNEDYNLGTVDVAHGTNGLGTITSTDFKDVRRVWYTTDGSNWYKASKIGIIDFRPDESFDNTCPKYYFQGDDIVGKKPDGESGTARIVYYRLGTVLSNDTDELPTVMKGYTKSFVSYGLANAYYLDGKEGLGDRYMGMANADREQFRSEITPRSKSGPEYISLVESINADDYDLWI